MFKKNLGDKHQQTNIITELDVQYTREKEGAVNFDKRGEL